MEFGILCIVSDELNRIEALFVGQPSSTSIVTVSCAVINELFFFSTRNNRARVLRALLQEQKVSNAYHMN